MGAGRGVLFLSFSRHTTLGGRGISSGPGRLSLPEHCATSLARQVVVEKIVQVNPLRPVSASRFLVGGMFISDFLALRPSNFYSCASNANTCLLYLDAKFLIILIIILIILGGTVPVFCISLGDTYAAFPGWGQRHPGE